MAKFQLLCADVALGGDIMNVVRRGRYEPVTYPEMLVMRHLHGPNSITNVAECGYDDRDPADEMNRLVETYGEVVRTTLFPGAQIQFPTEDKRIPKRDAQEPHKARRRPAPTPEHDVPQSDRSHDQRWGDGTDSGGANEGDGGPDGGEDKAQDQTQRPPEVDDADPLGFEEPRSAARGPLTIAHDNMGRPMTTTVNDDEKPAPKIAPRPSPTDGQERDRDRLQNPHKRR